MPRAKPNPNTGQKELRTVQLGLRLKPSTKNSLVEAAAADSRTVASLIEVILEGWLEKNHPAPKKRA